MSIRALVWFLVLSVGALAGCAGGAPQPVASWDGTWTADPDGHGGELRCLVRQVERDQWEGKFTGTCDRQFAYEVQMKGRRDGDSILFTGDADLGEKDGGLYHWTGRIVGEEFAGQYQSTSGKTGKFAMKPAEK
jgi:hypothetical protein